MTVTEVHRMPQTSPFSDMSPVIVAMLRDEANLSTARHVLDDARHDCLNRQEALRGQRPAFGFLAGKKQRDNYNASVASIESQLESIDTMILRVNNARERLQPGLRAALVDYLNQADPMYRQGLRASRYHEHWRRAHALVADRLKAFIRDSRESAAAIANDAAHGQARFSSDTTWRLGNARNAAVELDREIDALNKVAAEHQSFVSPTPFAPIHLPVIERWQCIQKIDMLMVRVPAEAAADAERLLNEFVELRQPSLQTILGIFEAVAAEHAQLAEARLRQCWSTLLAHAEAHLVSDAELEPTLLDIEHRQAAAEQARILGQVIRPFETER